ncbi:MAG: ABC transporter ATP-binding protein [Actinomycetota bacterium]
MNVAAASGLVKVFRSPGTRVLALDDVSLEIAPGEIFGLLGPNGAGKTTFIKCLLGLLRPDAGSVTLMGRPASDPEARRRVGFVPEVPGLPPYLSAEELMDFHGRLLGLPARERRSQTARLLDEASLTRAPPRIRAFSKGMVRRLALAQGLLGEPRFVALDEPTADLDPIGRRDVREQLLALRDRGVAALLNSHLLSEVERVCDRVAIMHKGRLLAVGAMEDLVPAGQDLESVFVSLIEGAR